MHKHTEYLEANTIISEFQSGFKPTDSTINQLAYLCNEFAKAIDESKEIRVVFLDISKAFNRVWHKGLLAKLRAIGFSENIVEWFSSYLENRKQRVCLGGIASAWLSIFAGVPQGSILGPILFLIFVPRLFKEKRRDIVFGIPSFRPSVLPSFRPPNIVGTLCAQLLLQFYADSFETLQMF